MDFLAKKILTVPFSETYSLSFRRAINDDLYGVFLCLQPMLMLLLNIILTFLSLPLVQNFVYFVIIFFFVFVISVSCGIISVLVDAPHSYPRPNKKKISLTSWYPAKYSNLPMRWRSLGNHNYTLPIVYL